MTTVKIIKVLFEGTHSLDSVRACILPAKKKYLVNKPRPETIRQALDGHPRLTQITKIRYSSPSALLGDGTIEGNHLRRIFPSLESCKAIQISQTAITRVIPI